MGLLDKIKAKLKGKWTGSLLAAFSRQFYTLDELGAPMALCVIFNTSSTSCRARVLAFYASTTTHHLSSFPSAGNKTAQTAVQKVDDNKDVIIDKAAGAVGQ